MRRFLFGVIVGSLLGASVVTIAQVDEPLTLRVPPITTDKQVWTPDQQMELLKMFQDFVTQQQTINRSFAGRMRQID